MRCLETFCNYGSFCSPSCFLLFLRLFRFRLVFFGFLFLLPDRLLRRTGSTRANGTKSLDESIISLAGVQFKFSSELALGDWVGTTVVQLLPLSSASCELKMQTMINSARKQNLLELRYKCKNVALFVQTTFCVSVVTSKRWKRMLMLAAKPRWGHHTDVVERMESSSFFLSASSRK